MFIVLSCLGLLSFIELCIFLCRLVLFVNTLAKWLAGKLQVDLSLNRLPSGSAVPVVRTGGG